jgi:hypothetical protein
MSLRRASRNVGKGQLAWVSNEPNNLWNIQDRPIQDAYRESFK